MHPSHKLHTMFHEHILDSKKTTQELTRHFRVLGKPEDSGTWGQELTTLAGQTDDLVWISARAPTKYPIKDRFYFSKEENPLQKQFSCSGKVIGFFFFFSYSFFSFPFFLPFSLFFYTCRSLSMHMKVFFPSFSLPFLSFAFHIPSSILEMSEGGIQWRRNVMRNKRKKERKK